MVSAFEGRPIKDVVDEFERVKSICSENADEQELMRVLDGRIYD